MGGDERGHGNHIHKVEIIIAVCNTQVKKTADEPSAVPNSYKHPIAPYQNTSHLWAP
jgi:hypothetical protein